MRRHILPRQHSKGAPMISKFASAKSVNQHSNIFTAVLAAKKTTLSPDARGLAPRE